MDPHIQFAVHLAGDQIGQAIEDEAEIAQALHDDAPAWLHLSADHADTSYWIDRHLDYLDPSIRAALIERQTRPRAVSIGSGLLVILRDINQNIGSDPEDMVSLRMWLDPHRIVSLSRHPIPSLPRMVERLRNGETGEGSGVLLADLVEDMTDRVEDLVSDLEDRTKALEAQVITSPREVPANEIADQRLELTELRRFLPPQRDAIHNMQRAGPALLNEPQRTKLAEQHDQLTRVVETLEALREQLQTIRDELEGARAERLNRNLYVLSVISAVFLPLGFLTGLMGINLAGMPGAHEPTAFWLFSAILLFIGIAVLALLRLFRIL